MQVVVPVLAPRRSPQPRVGGLRPLRLRRLCATAATLAGEPASLEMDDAACAAGKRAWPDNDALSEVYAAGYRSAALASRRARSRVSDALAALVDTAAVVVQAAARALLARARVAALVRDARVRDRSVCWREFVVPCNVRLTVVDHQPWIV